MTWNRMTDQMRVAMGYDELGNAPHLLAPQDARALCDVPRAGGEAICRHCHVLFRMHPVVQGALWATRTCVDGLVKL